MGSAASVTNQTGQDAQGDENIEVTLWLPADEETEDEMTVEAVLLVIYHREKVTQAGTRFEGFTEYRLTFARRSR